VIQLPVPLDLPSVPYTRGGLAVSLVLWWLAALAAVIALEQLAMPLGQPGLAIARRLWWLGRMHAGVVLIVTAVSATALATYPVLFFDRSLVSANDGSMPMLYNSFRLRGVSNHTIAMERLLKGMLAEESTQVS
jgi:hypothetical protein